MALTLSIVFNFVLAIFCLLFLAYRFMESAEKELAMTEWRMWETKFQEAQARLLSEYGIFISARGGPHGEMLIQDKRKQTANSGELE